MGTPKLREIDGNSSPAAGPFVVPFVIFSKLIPILENKHLVTHGFWFKLHIDGTPINLQVAAMRLWKQTTRCQAMFDYRKIMGHSAGWWFNDGVCS